MPDLSTLRIGVDSREVKTAANDLRALGGASADAEQKTGGLSKAFGGLKGVLAGIGLGFVVKEIITMADTMSSLTGRMALVTKNAGELAAVEARLFELAQQTRVGYESTVELYARLARSTQSMGASQASVLQVTETINKALIVSGTTAQEASGSLMQLGQAFASGALRGDELNSVMEGMPRVAQAIADGMGITVGELRKLGAQGKLTGAEVFNALQKSANSVATEFDKMPVTVGQSMTVLNNALMKFVGDVNASTGFTKALASIVIALSRHLDTVAAAAVAAALGFAAMKAQMALSAITSYISSVIALERALGATSRTTAIFSAVTKMAQGSVRALTVTMLANPFVAVAAAVIAIGFALYGLRDANIAVGGETVRLGDVFLGVWEVVKNAIAFVQTIFTQGWAQAFGSIAPALRAVGEFFDTAFSYIGNIIRTYVNRSIGLFVGLGAAIKAAFSGEDVIGAFTSGLNADYVGAFTSAVGDGVVALAHLGAASRTAAAEQADLGRVAPLTGQAVADSGKKAKDAAKQYRDYAAALRLETAQIGMTPEQSKQLEIDNKAREASAAGFQAEAAAITAAGVAYAEKVAAQKLIDLGKEAADLEFVNSLYGKQAVEVAVLTAAHDLMKQGLSATSAEYARFIAAVREGALQQEAESVRQAWEGLSADINFDAVFGDTGKAFAGILNGFDQMIERQKVYTELVDKGRMTEAQAAAARQKNTALQINSYGNIAGAMKGFFKEGSKGYKALQAAETVFRTIELAMAIKNAAVKIGLFGATTAAAVTGSVAEVAATATAEAAKTGITVAGTAVRTPLKVAEGAASMFAALGPLGFAAVAAMLVAMAALGFSGGGNKGKPPALNTGTGTVFGDSTKQSESIQKSIELLADVDTLTMRYSAQMAASLRNIEGNIGGLTNLILRTSGTEAGMKGSAAGVQEGNKPNIVGKVLGNPLGGAVVGLGVAAGLISTFGTFTALGALGGPIGLLAGAVIGAVIAPVFKALFGTKTSVVAQGITGVAQSMNDIMSGGFQGQYFTDIKKKKKFFGFSAGTSYSTQTTAADAELNRQFSLIFKGFYDAISAASVPLGLSLADVENRLNGFVVNIGKIDLKGLTGEEINEKLTAVFGAAADSIARTAIPGMEAFQKVGEGYFETVVRVASGVEQASAMLQQLGVTAIAYTDILNTQGDVAAEVVRQSILVNEASLGVAGGFAEIVQNANGTAEELVALVKQLRELQQMVVATGKAAIDLTTYMILGAGGADALAEGLQAFYDNVLTDAERSNLALTSLAKQFGNLGQTFPTTLAGFAALIASIDTTTSAGQQLYGSLIALTPAFVDVIDAANAARDAAVQAETSAIDNLRSAVDGLNSDVAKAEAALATAVAAAAKKQQDAAKAVLQTQLDGLKEQQKAATAAVGQFDALGKSMQAFSDGIFPMTGNGVGSLEALQRQFASVANRAQLGDTQAMTDLPGIGNSLVDAIIANASDRTSMIIALAAIKAQTDAAIGTANRQKSIAEQQLEALNKQITAVTDQIAAIGATTEAVLSVADAQAALDAARAARENTLLEINQAGFAGLLAVGAQTNAQLATIAIAAIREAQAQQAAADATSAAAVAAAAAAQQVAVDAAVAAAAAAAKAAADAAAAAAAAALAAAAVPEGYAAWLAGVQASSPTVVDTPELRAFYAGLQNGTIAIPGFADGGYFGGGLRMVGENGPELEATGPSRIYNANQTAAMFQGRETAEEIKSLRSELKYAMFTIAKNTGKTADQLGRWDGDGLPDTRVVAA